jgi:hypothetical protein
VQRGVDGNLELREGRQDTAPVDLLVAQGVPRVLAMERREGKKVGNGNKK